MKVVLKMEIKIIVDDYYVSRAEREDWIQFLREGTFKLDMVEKCEIYVDGVEIMRFR